jgi:hypothetical protein
MPYGELARRVGGPPAERSLETEEGPLTVEVTFGWAGAGKEGVRISATAYGPSWWRLDRLEETVTVPQPSGDACTRVGAHFRARDDTGTWVG